MNDYLIRNFLNRQQLVDVVQRLVDLWHTPEKCVDNMLAHIPLKDMSVRTAGLNYLNYGSVHERHLRDDSPMWIDATDFINKFGNSSGKSPPAWTASIRSDQEGNNDSLTCTCDIHDLWREGCKCGVMAEQRRIDAAAGN